jgi:CheY-like chemotaxis protein
MPKTLLLADDSRTIQQAVNMTFAGEDVKLITASDGEAALQAAKHSKPDLILADVAMPKLSGYELCQRVRGEASLKDVPVLLLGGPAPIDPAKAMAVGANGHMPKPFDSAKLIEHVKTILANPKAKPVIAAGASAPPKPPAPPARNSNPPPPRPAGSAVPTGSGSTMVMARPPMPAGATSPLSTPTSNPPRPPPAVARPGASAPPPAPRPPPPAAKPPVPGAPVAKPAAVPASRPPPPPPRPSQPPPAASRPPPPAAPALDDEEDIPLDEEVLEEAAAPSPTPTPLRPVPSAAHKPSLSVVPPPADGGEALLREALSKASREVIEKIAWEVVPELAETIIREELERLIKERGA